MRFKNWMILFVALVVSVWYLPTRTTTVKAEMPYTRQSPVMNPYLTAIAPYPSAEPIQQPMLYPPIDLTVTSLLSSMAINEPKGGFWRILMFLIVIALTVISTRIRSPRNGRDRVLGIVTTGIVIAVIGTVAGLLVHYAYACCDTPWYFYFGFPFSWLKGVSRSGVMYGLSFNDVIAQPMALLWWVGELNLVLDILFWFCAGVLLVYLSLFIKGSINMRKSVVTFILGIIVVLPLLAGCNSISTPNPTSEPEYDFPQQAPAEGERAVMEARLRGQLVSEDRCLRVNSRDGQSSHLIVWPPGVALQIVDGSPVIYDETGRVVARLGDYVQMGGGEIRAGGSGLSQQLSQPIPDNCMGPYWIVGEGLQVVKPHVRGTIKETYPWMTAYTVIYVDGIPDGGLPYEDAEVVLDGGTEIYREDENGYKRLSTRDLAVGQTVEVVFRVMVKSSPPAQGTADEVHVLSAEK